MKIIKEKKEIVYSNNIIKLNEVVNSKHRIENKTEIYNKLIQVGGIRRKSLVRYNTKLCIIKYNTSERTRENVSEEIVYKLSRVFNIKCCDAGIIKNNSYYSVVDEKIYKKLKLASDIVSEQDLNIIGQYKKLTRYKVSIDFKIDFIKMVMFDIMTRQENRDMSNYSLYRDGRTFNLYSLYSNGRSLFYRGRYEDSLNYRTRYKDNINNTIKYFLEEANNIGVTLDCILPDIDFNIIKLILSEYEKELTVDYKLIYSWMERQYKRIKSVGAVINGKL